MNPFYGNDERDNGASAKQIAQISSCQRLGLKRPTDPLKRQRKAAAHVTHHNSPYRTQVGETGFESNQAGCSSPSIEPPLKSLDDYPAHSIRLRQAVTTIGCSRPKHSDEVYREAKCGRCQRRWRVLRRHGTASPEGARLLLGGGFRSARLCPSLIHSGSHGGLRLSLRRFPRARPCIPPRVCFLRFDLFLLHDEASTLKLDIFNIKRPIILQEVIHSVMKYVLQ